MTGEEQVPATDTISISYSYQSYLKANRYHLRVSGRLWVFVGLGALLFLFALWLLSFGINAVNLLVLLYAIVMIGYPYTLFPLSVRRALAKNQSMRGRHIFSFDYDEAQIRAESDFGTFSHRKLHKVVDNPDLLMLYLNPYSFLFFRPDEFASTEEYIRVKEFCQSLVEPVS